MSRGYLSMGPVIRYVRLNPLLARKPWNEGLKAGCRMSHGRMHKMCFDNCHTFASDCRSIVLHYYFDHLFLAVTLL